MRVEGLAQKTTAEWLEIFAAADVPAARYNTLDDLLEDPHLQDVGFWTLRRPSDRRPHPPHPHARHLRRRHAAETLPAPRPGAQTDDILAEAGYSQAEIAALRETGAAQ